MANGLADGRGDGGRDRGERSRPEGVTRGRPGRPRHRRGTGERGRRRGPGTTTRGAPSAPEAEAGREADPPTPLAVARPTRSDDGYASVVGWPSRSNGTEGAPAPDERLSRTLRGSGVDPRRGRHGSGSTTRIRSPPGCCRRARGSTPRSRRCRPSPPRALLIGWCPELVRAQMLHRRHPADLPSFGWPVRSRVGVSRFDRRHFGSPRRTFAPRPPGLLLPRARRARCPARAQARVGLALGGEEGRAVVAAPRDGRQPRHGAPRPQRRAPLPRATRAHHQRPTRPPDRARPGLRAGRRNQGPWMFAEPAWHGPERRRRRGRLSRRGRDRQSLGDRRRGAARSVRPDRGPARHPPLSLARGGITWGARRGRRVGDDQPLSAAASAPPGRRSRRGRGPARAERRARPRW